MTKRGRKLVQFVAAAVAIVTTNTNTSPAFSFSRNNIFVLALSSTRRNCILRPTTSYRTEHVPNKQNACIIIKESEAVTTVDDNDDDKPGIITTTTTITMMPQQQNRKQAVRSILSLSSSAVFATTAATTLLTTIAPQPSNAYDRDFPIELTAVDTDGVDDNEDKKLRAIGVLRERRSTAQQRKQKAIESQKQLDINLANFNIRNDFLPSLTWGLAVYFITGSRASSTIATPLANILYDTETESWVQDRNDGLLPVSSEEPIGFVIVLFVLFVVIGTVIQYILLQLSHGDNGFVNQLAGVTVINGGFLELGRIASGEQKITRQENDREVLLAEEFQVFATNRIRPGGNCHRSDIVKCFRRYYAKYRQADSKQYPLTDREIEQLLRTWNKERNNQQRSNNNKGAEMSSSGFYYGIQINTDADVFG